MEIPFLPGEQKVNVVMASQNERTYPAVVFANWESGTTQAERSHRAAQAKGSSQDHRMAQGATDDLA